MPWKPVELEATPMDCSVMTRPEAIVTVSMNSVPGRVCKYSKGGAEVGKSPENDPEPYATD